VKKQQFIHEESLKKKGKRNEGGTGRFSTKKHDHPLYRGEGVHHLSANDKVTGPLKSQLLVQEKGDDFSPADKGWEKLLML